MFKESIKNKENSIDKTLIEVSENRLWIRLFHASPKIMLRT